MSHKQEITVLAETVRIQWIHKEDFICLTDIARYKDRDRTDYIIQNWLRSRNTIEFLGIWEHSNNPDFNPIEFDTVKNEAGSNAFGMTAKQWRQNHPDQKGNIHDYASVSQLICLSNLENLNALFINDGLSQKERLIKLNAIVIGQMKLLAEDHGVKKLEGHS
jgi:hypothetical protein